MNIELFKNEQTNESLVVRLNENNEVIEYVVCLNFNPMEKEGQQWDSGKYCGNNLQAAIDYMNDAIPRERLEEIALLVKDGLFSDDYKSAMEYINEIIEMTDDEKMWFGIE